MAHFAQIDDNNIVQQVLVIDQEEINTGVWGDPVKWIQTSYNTRAGIYYTPGTGTPDPDQSKALHKNYAGVGFTWLPNGPQGPGFAPPKPHESWVMNPFSYTWDPPVPQPVNRTDCIWNDTTQNWDCPVYSDEAPVYPD